MGEDQGEDERLMIPAISMAENSVLAVARFSESSLQGLAETGGPGFGGGKSVRKQDVQKLGEKFLDTLRGGEEQGGAEHWNRVGRCMDDKIFGTLGMD